MHTFFDTPDLTCTKILPNIGNHCISIGDRSHLQNTIKLIRCSKSGNKQKSISIDHKLYCATDTMAAGAVRYLREHGKKVPEDILVAGHGDSEIARVITPPIPTVHFSYEKSGEMAVEMLIEMMGQGETAVREVKLGYSLINI